MTLDQETLNILSTLAKQDGQPLALRDRDENIWLNVTLTLRYDPLSYESHFHGEVYTSSKEHAIFHLFCVRAYQHTPTTFLLYDTHGDSWQLTQV